MNTHSSLWYSHTDDHRGQLISNIISNSEHITLNTDTPTRVPHTTLQQAISPDITTIFTTLYNRTIWHTIHALNSDHLPIMTTINTGTNYKLQHNIHTFTNYRKANWTPFTTDTEAPFSDIQPPPDIHTANTIITNNILHADKHNIQKNKIHSTCKLLTDHIRHKIEHRNNIRAQNASDPSISELKSEITSLKQTHTSRHTLGSQRQPIYSLEDNTRISQQKSIITFKEKTFTSPTQIANAFNKHITNTVKHETHKTNRHMDRKTLKLQTTNLTLITTQIQAAIKHSKNNNSTGPDKVNIRHLKHIGPLGLAYLTNMYNTSINNNIIPHT